MTVSLFSLLGLFILSSFILVILLIGEQRKRSQQFEEIRKLNQLVNNQKKKMKELENKRDAFRLEVQDEKCEITFTDIMAPNCEELEYQTLTTNIQNISFAGIKIATDFDVPIRHKISAHIKFEFKGEKFESDAIILRKEEFLHQIPHMVYGLRFVGMDPKMQERLKLILNYAQADRYKGTERKVEEIL